MKKISIMLIFLITFSLLTCQSATFNQEEMYTKIEENICDINESGIKLQYRTKSNISEIINNVIDMLNIDDINLYSSYGKNYFNYYKESSNYSLKILITFNKGSNVVEIEIIDKKKLIDMNSIKCYLDKVISNNVVEKEYFTYVKGKINSLNEINPYDIVDKNYIKDIESISLTNGLTGVIDVKNGQKVNYSIMKYNNGTYLLVGTPIIFTTY